MALLSPMLRMVALYPADKRFLPIGGGAVGAFGDPFFKVGVQHIEIPAGAFAAELVDGVVGHIAAGGGVGEAGERAADEGAGVYGWRGRGGGFAGGLRCGLYRRFRAGFAACRGGGVCLRRRFLAKKFPRGNIVKSRSQ